MKTIQLNGADRKMAGGRSVFADVGEILGVGTEISADRAALLVARGGAVVVDPLDHDGDGRKGGAASPKGPAA